MNLLLIRPKSLNIISNINVIDLEPLDLEYLYTIALEEGVNCQIFDSLFDKRSLLDVLKEYEPDITALCGYITQEPLILEYSKKIKEYNPSIKVMVGGVHAQVNYERFYTDTIDFIVHSNSLEPFRRLLRLWDNYDALSLRDIKGICYRNGGKWTVNDTLLINPDELPIPDRSHFNKNKHMYRYLGFTPCAIVKTAYSCPYNCSFCFCRKINGGKYAARSIDLVVEEIAGIDCDNIHIVDDTFLVDRGRVNRFIELIRERKIDKNFIFYSRADFVVKNEDLIKELAAIGTKGIIVGLEAIDDTTLNSYSKQSSEDLNLKCVSILQRHNIDCLGLFIIDINATKKDFVNLYNWVKKTNLRYASPSIFTPIPGTSLYDDYRDKITTDKMQNWDFLHLVMEPVNMSKKAFYLEYYKLFIRLTMLGRKRGIYDFVDMKYIRKTSKEFFSNLLHSL